MTAAQSDNIKAIVAYNPSTYLYPQGELPPIGIKVNTHFLMSDFNNIEIADQLLQWLKEKELDK